MCLYINLYMVFFAAIQSNNAPGEDEGDEESNLDDHRDEFDQENDKGSEIRTMNPCILRIKND